MKRKIVFTLLSCLLGFLATSCSDDDTTLNPTSGMTKIGDGYVPGAGAKFELWAEEELFAGYNRIYFTLYDSLTGSLFTEAQIQVEPIMDMGMMTHSCPVEAVASKSQNQLFSGAIMFTMPSGDMGTWSLTIKMKNPNNGRSGTSVLPVSVRAESPSRIISFVDEASGSRYFLSYYFPEQMKVGVNEFELIAFTASGHDFIPVEDLSIKLAPEMPSMDHGSPNNVDPVHNTNGHYSGKVNFTMTGEWRLNLELKRSGISVGTKAFDVVVK